MVLVAYVDESGKDQDSPLFLLAGYLGTEKNWRKAEIGFTKLLYESKVKRFHTVDLWGGAGDFKHWSAEQKDRFLVTIAQLAGKYLDTGFAVTLNKADFETHYRRGRKTGRLHSGYAACVRHLLPYIVYYVSKKRECREVRFVFDQGHHNAGGAKEVFDELKSKWNPEHERRILGEIAFKPSKEVRLLGFADALAYHNFKLQTQFQDQRKIGPYSVDAVSGFHTAWLPITPEALEHLYKGETLQLT